MLQQLRRIGEGFVGRRLRSLPVAGTILESGYGVIRDHRESQHIKRGDEQTILRVGENEYHYLNKGDDLILEEYECISYATDLVSELAVVYDIGANVGHHTVPYADIADQVFAFEPLPANLAILKENLELNEVSNVKIYSTAISDSDGTAAIQTSEGTEVPDARARIIDSTDGDPCVDTWSLDAHQAELPDPDCVKIDIEGAEHQALLGGRNFFESTGPTLLIEVHRRKLPLFDSSKEALMETISEMGYEKEAEVRPSGPDRDWLHFEQR